jgi:hypothetical protein
MQGLSDSVTRRGRFAFLSLTPFHAAATLGPYSASRAGLSASDVGCLRGD